VDEQSAYVFQYKNGALAMLSSSFQTNGPKEAVICGDKGLIRVPLFWRGQSAVVELNGQAPEQHDFPFVSSGLQYQAAAMMEALRSGQREEPWMTPAASVALHQQMDALRQTWGLVYPGE
jgi:predicted dehydrogenase